MIKLIDLYSGNSFSAGQLKMEGYSGVIFKAGQGAWADVPRYHPEWWTQARDAGLLTGWYWLIDSRHHSSAHIDEIKKFKVLEDIGELGFWIDVEKPRVSMTENDYWQTPFAGHQNVIDFAYLLTLEGITPGIYTGPGAYHLVMRDAPKTAHEYLSKFDLWTAQYPYKYVEGVSKPDIYGTWSKWTLWQYQEGIDINIFNGTDEEFQQKYGEVIKPPIGETGMYKGTVLVTNLNIRPSASTSASAIAKLYYNDKVEADIVEQGWWKLKKITRGTADIPLPAPVCYAYEGSTKGYIRTDSVDVVTPPAEGDVNVVVNISAGITTVTVNGTEYHK